MNNERFLGLSVLRIIAMFMVVLLDEIDRKFWIVGLLICPPNHLAYCFLSFE